MGLLKVYKKTFTQFKHGQSWEVSSILKYPSKRLYDLEILEQKNKNHNNKNHLVEKLQDLKFMLNM